MELTEVDGSRAVFFFLCGVEARFGHEFPAGSFFGEFP